MKNIDTDINTDNMEEWYNVSGLKILSPFAENNDDVPKKVKHLTVKKRKRPIPRPFDPELDEDEYE